MKELKKFNVLSVGKFFLVFGFIVSVLQMIVLKLMSTSSTVALQYGISASQFTFKFISFTVITATITYFISGLFIALIYNLAAKQVGGIRFDLGDAKASVKKKSAKKRK